MNVQTEIDILPYKIVYDRSPTAFALLQVLLVDGEYDDFLFVYANKGYEKMSGFSTEVLNGHTYFEVCGEKSSQWNKLYGKVAYEGGEHSSIEFGPEINRYINIQCYQVKPGYCATTVLDITEQVRAEQKAKYEFQRKYELEKQRTLHDRSIMAYAVFDLETHETLELQRNAQLMPIRQDASLEEFKEDIAADIVSDEQRKQFREMFDEASLLQKYSEGIEEQSMEFMRKMSGGKVIWVRARLYLMVEPNGTDTLLIYSCRDVNTRKSLEIMTSFIVQEDYDMLGYVNFADDSAVMWYGKSSLHGSDSNRIVLTEEKYSTSLETFINQAVVPEEREQYRTKFFIQKVKEELTLHRHFSFNLHVFDAQGKIRTKEIRYTRYDQDAAVCMFTQIDITDLLEEKEQEKQVLEEALANMKQANAAQSDFLAKMSHELRTPLNVIIGSSVLACDIPDANQEILEYVHQIDYSAKYLLSMINDILDARKMEQGNFKLQNEWVRPGEVLTPALSMMAAEFKNHGIHFIYEENCTIESDVFYYLDVIRCRQIVTNLLNNALKFTPAGGTVSFLDEHLEGNAQKTFEKFVVSDTGCGMSREFQKKMFNPFSQERNVETASVQGTGLGLTVVKQLIDSMGGTITVESERGRGTTFTIIIPFLWKKEVGVQVQSEKGASLKNLEGKHVLLFEDHATNAAIARRLLEKKGMLVEVASNGEEGIEVYLNHEKYFDAILMDIRMPIMDGLTATRKIRSSQKPDAQTIPIIAMTANAYNEDIQESLKAGMNTHLAKPIEPEKLYATLSRYL